MPDSRILTLDGHVDHYLFHSERERKTGFVPIGAIIKTVSETHRNRAEVIHSGSLAYENELLWHADMQAKSSHKNDKRKMINPVTGDNYNFAIHPINVVSILANLNYLHRVLRIGYGHDFLEKVVSRHLKAGVGLNDSLAKRKLIKGIMADPMGPFGAAVTDTIEVISELGLRDPNIRGSVQSKNLDKEEFMAKTLITLLQHPEAIPVKGADRLDNLLTPEVYSLQALRRQLVETAIHYLPLMQIYDSILYGALKTRTNELISDPNLMIKYEGTTNLMIAEAVIFKYAQITPNDTKPFNIVKQLVDSREYIEGVMKRGRYKLGANHILESISQTGKSIDIPNMPDIELVENLASMISPNTGIDGVSTLKIEERWRTGLAQVTIGLLGQLFKTRELRSTIEKYFDHVGEVELTDSDYCVPSNQIDKLYNAGFEQLSHSAYMTTYGEKMPALTLYGVEDKSIELGKIQEVLGLGEPMVILDRIFEWGRPIPSGTDFLDINRYQITDGDQKEGVQMVFDLDGVSQQVRSNYCKNPLDLEARPPNKIICPDLKPMDQPYLVVNVIKKK